MNDVRLIVTLGYNSPFQFTPVVWTGRSPGTGRLPRLNATLKFCTSARSRHARRFGDSISATIDQARAQWHSLSRFAHSLKESFLGI